MVASVTTISLFPASTGGGAEPDGQLFMASNGDLLGATVDGGGAGDIGTTYEIVKTGTSFATTPTFLADIPSGVSQILGVPNLSADASGDLFSVTFTGGANHFGTVVEFPAAGGDPITLATFTGGAGGSQPGGKLLVDASGNLFGTTTSGGASGAGTVFELKNTGGVYATTPTTLTSFGSGITPAGSGNLVADAQGNLFGVTSNSVFEVKKTGSSYAAPVNLVPFPVGTQIGSLAIDAKGDIFGTTISGGANDDGTVFEIEKISTGYAGSPTTLASFTPADGQLTLNHPKTLIVDANGDLFGTTDPSTQNPGGVVYEIVKTPLGYDSEPVIVVSFGASATQGLGANVVADASGDLFTTTLTGGANSSSGAVLKITGSGFATTPSVTPVASSILWQNTSGQASIWNMDGNILIGGGPVTPNPGPSFRAVGTGDFNKDGKSDILWQNTSTGQASIWEMNGNTLQGGGPVSPNPGLVFDAVGTGDFNGDGFSDILWQNTSTGQASIWEMNGNTLEGGGPVTPNPGLAWKAIGTGDFNKDGDSDILWQNTDTGAISIWEMHGNTLVGGGQVTPNPGTAWQAIGTGDFNKDGFADILLQNKDTGAVSVWEMNGNTLIGGGQVANPGLSWHAIGTGAGGSDILLQNTSGQATIWEMNGNTIAGGGPVSPNPGPTWHAIALT
jgi:uncharacterized repeat protein (TIGR03803 family)